MHEPATAGRSGRRLAPFVSLGAAVVLAALFVVLANSKADKPDVTSSFLYGKPAPAVVSTTLDGETFDLSRRKGSWVVLNFFQSTCLPCKAEHPELVAFVAQQAGIADGNDFLGLGNPVFFRHLTAQAHHAIQRVCVIGIEIGDLPEVEHA